MKNKKRSSDHLDIRKGDQKIETNIKIEPSLIKKFKKQRGEGSDAVKVIKRIKGFDPNESEACRRIHSKFGQSIVHKELKAIAEIICEKIGITLDRDAKRDDRVLHKWFQENWEVIEPLIERIQLYDKNDNLIQGANQNKQ